MNFIDPSSSLIAASGGDTVKLFDVSIDSGDPCVLTYTPSPGCHVNSVKWNHTNLVVASAGDDKKISLWRKNGQSMGTFPMAGTDSGDNIEESISTISFSNKGSRYICSGGSGKVVRIWDLQRKRCIKWLKGHTDTITGALYNSKDEYLASISLNGDLILHNLASGAKPTELKDPNQQVLRVLDFSRISRHLLVTAGDGGSVHLWDTTGRSSPKASWLNKHSAPTTGVSFSPSNDKMIASVGLDKKLYTFDLGTKKTTFCIPYEAPFSSLAFRDDGYTLAAGTSKGRVVFYDVRGKPQPLTVLRAYGNSEAVTSLCWQRSKPVAVNENNCTADTALLGGAGEDSILMPDPLPGRSGANPDSFSFSEASSGSTAEETPIRSTLWNGGKLGRLHPTRSYNFKDDMEVFSPLVEVQPITPSFDKLWDEHGGAMKGNDKKPAPLFPSSRRFPLPEEGSKDTHPLFDWKISSTFKQDDNSTFFSPLVSTPTTSSSTDESSSITPPEAWGGERLSEKFAHLRHPGTLPSRFAALTTNNSLLSGSTFSGLQDLTLSSSSSPGFAPLQSRDVTSYPDTSLGFPEHIPFPSTSISLGAKSITGQANLETVGPASTLPRRYSSYAERISSTPSFSDGTPLSVASPKTKKTGTETREELLSGSTFGSDITPANEARITPSMNGGIMQHQKTQLQPDSQQGTSFTLQLFQRTLEETLGSFQKSIHEDMRNLHIEVLRQFHMQETEMSTAMNSILKNQAELMKEVQSLRKENQQLRQLL